ncbi:MAG: tRNA uridine-5-carboxymethylaminomethyl(34) synthesis enzyme MnmG, partial [Oscillospiraceae bacterium]|nr:tRNA uridine-5-carboxymethylaminomethyl(34) synthesis enzyme MnmG [Oscillospiraceae bacterium]
KYVKEQVELDLKYEGYISKQQLRIDQQKKLESRQIPQNFDYSRIKGLRLEAVEKLQKHAPTTLAAAAQISGVSPADISVLSIALV